jgi:hypothetical protein
VRDVSALACHTFFHLEARLESYGRTLLGLRPSGII